MYTRTILAAMSAIALTAATATGQTGTHLPITNITVNAGSVRLDWAEPLGKSVNDLKIWQADTLTGPWAEVTAPLTKNLGNATVATVNTDAVKFFKLYADVSVNGPFPYTPGTEVTWGQVDHTILINLTNNFKVTWYPADHNVKADPAGKTHHLYLRRIKANTTGVIGSPTDEWGRSTPPSRETRRTVTLTKGYYMGVYKVTAYQHDLIDLFDASTNPSPSLAVNGNSERPAVGTTPYTITSQVGSWNYIRGSLQPNVVTPAGWMKKLEDAVKLGNGGLALGFDLPTEAQWEIATRAGTEGTFSDGLGIALNQTDLDTRLTPLGWYWGNASGIKDVGELAANPAGMYDVHGNVYEWCLDAFHDVNASGDGPNFNGTGLLTRATRACHWNNTAVVGRSAARGVNNNAAYSGHYTGFRLRAGGLASDAVVTAP